MIEEPRHLTERPLQSADEARGAAVKTHRLRRSSQERRQWTARVQGKIAGDNDLFYSFDQFGNRLLALIPSAEFERLVPLFQVIRLSPKQVLHRTQMEVKDVYFPISGLLSASVTMQDGSTIEVAEIGREGMIGMAALFGTTASPYDVAVQVPGHALRVELQAFRSALHGNGLLQDILLGYQDVMASQNVQQIACNGLHTLTRRCCRRLLSAQDRLGTALLPLTHEALALALGVRRASITEELSLLQSRGAVNNRRRAQIEIVDRPALQTLACECYHAMNDRFAHLLKSAGSNADWLSDVDSPPPSRA